MTTLRTLDSITGAEVRTGTEVEDFRGKVWVLDSATRAGGDGRDGKVLVRSFTDRSDVREVYARVVGLRVVADETPEPAPALCCPDWPMIHVHARSCRNSPRDRGSVPLALALVLAALALLLLTGAALAGVRTYGTPGVTLNGGVTYGDCGVELWGTPGHFCGNY